MTTPAFTKEMRERVETSLTDDSLRVFGHSVIVGKADLQTLLAAYDARGEGLKPFAAMAAAFEGTGPRYHVQVQGYRVQFGTLYAEDFRLAATLTQEPQDGK